MTVALNTSLSAFGANLPDKGSELNQDGPKSKERFEKLYRDESYNASSKRPSKVEDRSKNNEIDPDIQAAKDHDATQSLHEAVNPQVEGQLQPTPQISLPGSGDEILSVEATGLQNAMGSVDLSELSPHAPVRVQTTAPADTGNLDAPLQTARIPQNTDLTTLNTPAIPNQTNIDGQLVRLQSADPSLGDVKSQVGDALIGRTGDVTKEILVRPESSQLQASLSAENYIKTAAVTPTTLVPEVLISNPDGFTATLAPVTTQQSEALQRALGAQTIANAQAQTSSTPPALQIVSNNLIKALVSQSGVSMRLDPPEMGNVQINFQFDSERAVTAVIRSELADTSSFLRERAEHLQQALKDSGFDSITLSFEQGSQSNQDDSLERETYKESIFTLDEDLGLKAQQTNLDLRTSNVIVRNQPVDIKL